MKITIDPHSGFCFGVVYAIQMAEEELDRSGKLYCLGDIVHNNMEVERLRSAIQMAEEELDRSGKLYCLGDIVHNNMEVERLRSRGLEIIDHERMKTLHDCKVLIRAHGEPPETYQVALKNNIELIDASCPVVLKLQHRVRTSFEDVEIHDGQIVIYGEEGHAEVNGLVGQTEGKAIIVKTEEDLSKIDFTKPVYFFSQTTKSTKGFEQMKEMIQQRVISATGNDNPVSEEAFESNDTICRQVSNREPQLKNFSREHDVVVFVSGKKSSNGKALYEVCKSVNPATYFVSDVDEIQSAWFEKAASVGICGATSTPMWLMEKVAEFVKQLATTEV
ncbi:MAG: 4-hydroxy-3-methylbut-2-enyl diphosphate reductase [Bacteroidetes bacterium]|nr:4-hydroxy-3-methylbut-2-enyl diphosphate reductase [Bacteroidota bacterium]